MNINDIKDLPVISDFKQKVELFKEIYRLTDDEAKSVVSGDKAAIKSFIDKIYHKSEYDGKIDGTPYYYLFSYIPKKYGDQDDTEEKIRKLIYGFKNGNDNIQKYIAWYVGKKLQQAFPESNLLSFVCVPASSSHKNKIRYTKFLKTCKEMICNWDFNTIKWIRVTKDASKPSHMGGEEPAEYSFDKDVWKGKMVVLFDDVVTSGKTIKKFKNKIESLGAQVVFFISLGKTPSANDDYIHPYIEEFNPDLFHVNGIPKFDDSMWIRDMYK